MYTDITPKSFNNPNIEVALRHRSNSSNRWARGARVSSDQRDKSNSEAPSPSLNLKLESSSSKALSATSSGLAVCFEISRLLGGATSWNF